MYYLLQVLSKEDGYPIVEETRLYRQREKAIRAFYNICNFYNCDYRNESEYTNGIFFMGEGSRPQDGLNYVQVHLIDLPDSNGTPRC